MILLRMTMKFSENILDPYKPMKKEEKNIQNQEDSVSAYQHIFDVIVSLVIQEKINIFGAETIY